MTSWVNRTYDIGGIKYANIECSYFATDSCLTKAKEVCGGNYKIVQDGDTSKIVSGQVTHYRAVTAKCGG